jgi:hypothetical protein
MGALQEFLLPHFQRKSYTAVIYHGFLYRESDCYMEGVLYENSEQEGSDIPGPSSWGINDQLRFISSGGSGTGSQRT